MAYSALRDYLLVAYFKLDEFEFEYVFGQIAWYSIERMKIHRVTLNAIFLPA